MNDAASSNDKPRTTSARRYFGPDPNTSRLRATVAALGREIEAIGGHTRVSGQPSALVAHYDKLVRHLALGPEPEVRACPRCGTFGMRAATVCGQCWMALPPAS